MLPVIVIVRHAEKQLGGRPPFGITIDGIADPASLTPRGWQRAGALVGLFVPRPGSREVPLVPVPTHLVACRPGERKADSRRPLETLEPLSERLDVPVDDRFFRDELEPAAAAIVAYEGVVVVAWEHKMIPPLATVLIGTAESVPDTWPDDRFDVAWILEPHADAGQYRLRQVPQLLLGGDVDEPI